MCGPSRASILTGLYPHNHRVFTNDRPAGGASGFRRLDGSTPATWLHDAGYRTALFGKYFNDYAGTYQPGGWYVWHVNEPDEMTTQRAERFIRSSAKGPAPFSRTWRRTPPPTREAPGAIRRSVSQSASALHPRLQRGKRLRQTTLD
jgi:arylsulfatase A-like enzyme